MYYIAVKKMTEYFKLQLKSVFIEPYWRFRSIC